MTKKVALVTGGMGGIGVAICRALADAGMTVVTTFSKAGREAQWLADQAAAGYAFGMSPHTMEDNGPAASLTSS